MLKELFYQTVGDMDKVLEASTGDEYLKHLCRHYHLTHAAYLGINLPLKNDKNTYIIATYSEQWIKRYISQEYVNIDPVIQGGLRGIMPIDWQECRGTNKDVETFFGEAREFGVARQGVTLPIRGIHHETAMFSINCDMSDNDWRKNKRDIIQTFWIMSHYFHTNVLEMEGVAQGKEINLSKREIECLKWAASGKTEWETSEILGISKRTVEFFLTNARSKLDAFNKTQAIVKAIRLNLI